MAATLAGLWSSRLRLATSIVDRKLAAAGVPAAYRITAIGPFRERLEDVRLGDPAHPDLLARRIEVTIGYGPGGPKVTGIAADGVRLRATLDRAGLHLGAVDRLLPGSRGGGTMLPDLDLTLRDARLALATPNGTLAAELAGRGNPARRFTGQARIEAATLRLAACTLRGTTARLTVGATDGRPSVRGPIRIAGTSCRQLNLGPGIAQVAAAANTTFDRVALTALPHGFGGTVGPARFGAIRGTVAATGALGRLGVRATLGLDHVAVPAVARTIAAAGRTAAGTPVAPVLSRAAEAAATLLRDARAGATLDAAIVGVSVTVRVRRAALVGRDGARAAIVERGGLAWRASGWRSDGDIALTGGALPTMTLALRQVAEGARLTAIAAVAPYRAGEARLAIPAVRLDWDGTALRFAGRLALDGPLGQGAVRGLALTVAGALSRGGDLTIGTGCQPVGFTSLRLGGVTLDGAHFALCGAPIVRRTAAGVTRIAASTGPIRLTGRSAAGAPVTLAAARLRLTASTLAADALTAAIGDSHLRIARLAGSVAGGRIGGDYAGAAGAIANVPLLLSDGDGAWTFADGALTLAGGLRVSDAAPAPRFHPLATDNLRLTLRDGAIAAAATLRAPTSHSEVARIELAHRLADSTGHALIAVPGITFAPKALQPDTLTPLTLGVVANVAGTVSGSGRIDWSAAGATSEGTFGTDRLDLAAAFGPVAGIRTHLRFTDLLGLVSAPHQAVTIAEVNPGVAVADGIAHVQLLGGNRLAIEDAAWPFASGLLRLEPTTLDFAAEAERRLTFRVDGLDAAAFVQQLDFPNLAATGRFDGVLPMIFDSRGGRIEGGSLVARRGGGTLAYVGELSRARIGTIGALAFEALKAIRYSVLDIRFDGRLDGEMISEVHFTGVREATPDRGLLARLIRNLPFRFNIRIRAPFRGLVGSARAYLDPRLLLTVPSTTRVGPRRSAAGKRRRAIAAPCLTLAKQDASPRR